MIDKAKEKAYHHVSEFNYGHLISSSFYFYTNGVNFHCALPNKQYKLSKRFLFLLSTFEMYFFS